MGEKQEPTLAEARGTARISLENILFATDFSPASEAALDYAVAIARRYEARIFIAHVIAPDAYQLVPPEATTRTYELVRRRAEQEMTNLLISGRLRDISHQVLLGEGLLWPTLSEMIQKNGIDLTVVGTHGRTGVRKVLLGSAAEEIFRLAHCPVLTVGPKVVGAAAGEAELRRILYATDFTAHAEHAAGYALSLAQEHQARLTFLHVVRDVNEVSARSMEVLREFFAHRLQKIVPPESELWFEPEFAVEFGQPVDEILRTARERKANLIAMGVRGGVSFAGHLPPATAYRVVCQAHCPVLTIRS